MMRTGKVSYRIGTVRGTRGDFGMANRTGKPLRLSRTVRGSRWNSGMGFRICLPDGEAAGVHRGNGNGSRGHPGRGNGNDAPRLVTIAPGRRCRDSGDTAIAPRGVPGRITGRNGREPSRTMRREGSGRWRSGWRSLPDPGSSPPSRTGSPFGMIQPVSRIPSPGRMLDSMLETRFWQIQIILPNQILMRTAPQKAVQGALNRSGFPLSRE